MTPRTEGMHPLAAATQEMCERHIPSAAIRAMAEGTSEFSSEPIAELGVFELLRDATSLSDAAAVFTELGRRLVPGPLVASCLAAATDAADSDAGLATVGVASDGGWIIPDLPRAATVYVVGRRRVRRIETSALDATSVGTPLDPLTPISRTASMPDGDVVGDSTAAERWRVVGALLTAAQQVGIAAAVYDATVQHARNRHQFGQPVGGFQAVKHQVADMLVDLRLARAAVSAAADVLDPAAAGLSRPAVASAKLLADQAARRNCKRAIQLHGGMGYTWDMDIHLFFKRSCVHRWFFGDPAWCTGEVEHWLESNGDTLSPSPR